MPKLLRKHVPFNESLGLYYDEYELSHDEINKCPHVIFDISHYTENTCKCYDKNAKEMKEWGYKWSKKKGQWV